MSDTMKLLKHSKPIDVSDWNWSDDTEVDAWVAKIVANGLENTFEEWPPTMSLPVYWSDWDGKTGKNEDGFGGPAPKDPATLYVGLPFAGENEHLWSITLEDLISETFFFEAIWDDEPYTASASAKALAARLRELADELETGPKPLPDVDDPDAETCAECDKPVTVKRNARTKELAPGDYVYNGDPHFPAFWHKACFPEVTFDKAVIWASTARRPGAAAEAASRSTAPSDPADPSEPDRRD